MQTSFQDKDVTVLLKDLTGCIKPMPTEEREKLIQSGTHYSEMLPLEYVPSEHYIEMYEKSLIENAKKTANSVGVLAMNIYSIAKENEPIVLVSLARAGIPAAVLIKRYLEHRFHIDVKHYAISIIRDKGIDKNAMSYILDRHGPENIFFIDGWTGKGTIYKVLADALKDYPELSIDKFGVLADPANIMSLCGTHEDFIIPSSCLNSTVSGLISRTILRSDLIDEDDFHGAVYYPDLKDADRTYEFIHTVQNCFDWNIRPYIEFKKSMNGINEVKRIAGQFKITDINKIKPGIGETTRVLLRRVPEVILIKDMTDTNVRHIIQLANEKGVQVKEYPLKCYNAVGLIKELSDV